MRRRSSSSSPATLGALLLLPPPHPPLLLHSPLSHCPLIPLIRVCIYTSLIAVACMHASHTRCRCLHSVLTKMKPNTQARHKYQTSCYLAAFIRPALLASRTSPSPTLHHARELLCLAHCSAVRRRRRRPLCGSHLLCCCRACLATPAIASPAACSELDVCYGKRCP